jgi:hypothetical protein
MFVSFAVPRRRFCVTVTWDIPQLHRIRNIVHLMGWIYSGLLLAMLQCAEAVPS